MFRNVNVRFFDSLLPTFKVHHAEGSKTGLHFAEQFVGFN